MTRSRDCLACKIFGRDIMALRQGLDVRDEPPNLVVGDSSTPSRHSVRPTFVDRLEDVTSRTAKVPAVVLETRAHCARAIGAVAIHAIVSDEKLSALGNSRGVPFVGICENAESSLKWKTRLDVVGVFDEVGGLGAGLRLALAWRRRHLRGTAESDSESAESQDAERDVQLL
jgi:hypothetical protein